MLGLKFKLFKYEFWVLLKNLIVQVSVCFLSNSFVNIIVPFAFVFLMHYSFKEY